jgi:uncharacterized membrane protein
MSTPKSEVRRRIASVDILRGVVMIIMLLDHVRDYVFAGGLTNNPTDLTKTNAVLFFTRWITHFCAPTFVFLSGTSIYLQRLRGKSNGELSRFLLTRGLWLIVLEFTVVRFSLFFNVDYSFFGMAEVIWVFGVSMIVLAGLIHLPVKAVGAIGLLMIVFHNLLDGITVPLAIAFAGAPPPDALQSLWLFLHQTGFVPLFGGASKLLTAYPLIPWIGVMAAGYALGSVYSWDPQRRRRWLLRLGLAATGAFILVRGLNVYGDPSRWQYQTSPAFTFLSFLNTTKYPPSLLFLLMTLGPSLLVLAASDRADGTGIAQRIVLTFGRVPLFYFILQMFYAHGVGVLLGYVAGKDVGYLFLNPDGWSTAPPDNGFPLWAVYIAWLTGVVILYPICRWYGEVKRRSGHWLFSYL